MTICYYFTKKIDKLLYRFVKFNCRLQRNEADKLTAKNLIKKQVADTGITLSELSRKTGIPYNKVHRTLRGNARLMATDFLVYCKVLKIEIK